MIRTPTVREGMRPARPTTPHASNPTMKPTLAILALTTPTLADGTATWLWDVTTQDGDTIVEPGETASVTLALLMEPSPGGGPWVGLGAAIFDTIGMRGADQGHIAGWTIHNDLSDLIGDQTTTDGVSLFGTEAGQVNTFGPFVSDNPIDVITFEWVPDTLAPLDVAYQTVSAIENVHVVLVYEGEDKESALATFYPVTEAAITFTVVPTPPTLLLLAIFTLPRRRSAPPR